MRDTRRTRLVLSVLLVAALALITLDYRDGSAAPLRGLRQFGGSVFGSTERGFAAAAHPVVRFFGGSAAIGGPSPQVAALETEVTRLRAELSRARLSRAQYAQLRRLLQVAGRGGYRIVAADVIAVGQGYTESVTLDAGSQDGIRPQETVLTGAGLLKLQVLDTSAALQPGEQLVTSASVRDRPYVPGVPVGVISKVERGTGSLTARALVRPYAELTALGVVGIVVAPPRHDPRFSVLPPSPRAKPAPTVTVTVTPSASPSAGPAVGLGG